jgi:hypothetical protein
VGRRVDWSRLVALQTAAADKEAAAFLDRLTQHRDIAHAD